MHRKRLTLIHNEHLGPQPSRRSLLVLLDLRHEGIRVLDTETNAAKGMQRDTANVARCYARRSSHRDSIGCRGVLFPQSLDDFTQKHGFTGTLNQRLIPYGV
jgi:hypothetical protein